MCSISGLRKKVQKLATRGLGDDTGDKSHIKVRRHKYGEPWSGLSKKPALGREPLLSVPSQEAAAFETPRLPVESVR
jgi:hypothetical protein